MVKVKGSGFSLPDTPLVPYPSGSLVPERDVDYMPVLEARHLGIDFGGLTAVDDFSLTIGRTEIAGLIGPNGAGKTTVFNLLTSVYQPTRGSVLISGIPTAGKSTYQVSQMRKGTGPGGGGQNPFPAGTHSRTGLPHKRIP